MRFKSTWRTYRYDSKPTPKIKRIFTGESKKHALQGVIAQLKKFHTTPFEHEANCKNNIRRLLCLKGYDWKRADYEAQELTREALGIIGAKRPTWDEGQWHYLHPRENCARCGSQLDDEDYSKGFRYCSAMCAKSYREHIASELPWDHDLRRQGYWQIVIHNSPLKNCPTCSKDFKSKYPNARYCSPECLPQIQKQLQQKQCIGCENIFSPKCKNSRYCSRKCYVKNQSENLKLMASANICSMCNKSYIALSKKSLYCSDRCWKDSKNQRRRKKKESVNCIQCGKQFERLRSDHRYCSGTCSAKASDIRLAKTKNKNDPIQTPQENSSDDLLTSSI